MRFGCIVVLLAVALALPPKTALAGATGHDLEYAVAGLVFHDDGRFEITVSFHVVAYVLEAEPAHLSLDDWVRLRSMSDGELRRLVAHAREHFIDRLDIRVDGAAAQRLSVAFPDERWIRRDGLSTAPERAPPVVIRGRAPADSAIGASAINIL